MRRKILFVYAISLVSHQLSAQNFERIDPFRHMKETIQFMSDGNGQPFKPTRGFEEEGSPFFYNDYLESTIQLMNGKSYHRIPVKINYLTGELLFKTEDGQEMSVIKPFQRVAIKKDEQSYIFRSGFPAIDKQTEFTLYELIDSGAAVLLKYTSVSFQDKQPYNGVNIIRTYHKKEVYYSYIPSKGLLALPSETEALVRLFEKDAILMAEFANKHKLKAKKESDLKKLFAYYNSLKK
ncbi:MAG: hypothetical protein IBJ16_01545 [Chitinophagaceae bacterium]|nr:hypothetical protein [Chitinophagaceae bacterium]